MSLKDDLLKVGNEEIDYVIVNKGSTVNILDESGIHSQLYIQRDAIQRRITFREFVENEYPEPPKDIFELHNMLIESWCEIPKPGRKKDRLRNSAKIVEKYLMY